MSGRLWRLSILSGLFWGLVAVVAMKMLTGSGIYARVLLIAGITGALVGLTTGAVLYRLPRKRTAPLWLISVVTLVVMTFVFWLLMGAAAELLSIGEFHPDQSTPVDRIFVGAVFGLYGLLATGLIFLLWPLAFMNHVWFFKVRDHRPTIE